MRKLVTMVALCVFAFNLILQDLVQTASAQSTKQYSLSVLNLTAPFEVMAPSDARIISDNLVLELGNTGLFNTMSQIDMERGLLTANIDASNCSQIACAVRAGQALGTQLVVIGSIERVGSNYAVDVKMVHVTSREIVKEYQDSFDADLTALYDGMRVVAKELVGTSGSLSRIPQRQGMPPVSQQGSADIRDDFEGPTIYDNDSGGIKWYHVGLGLLVAGGVGAGILLLTDSGSSNSTTTPGTPEPASDLPGPPTFP